MKKIILSGITVFSLFCPTLLGVLTRSTAACPVKEPETLLSLYQTSESIYRARFTGEDRSEPKKQRDTMSIVEVSRHFDVLATHKGKSVEKVTLFNDQYLYEEIPAENVAQTAADESMIEEKPAAASDEEAVEEEPEAEEVDEDNDDAEYSEMKAGDEVLLFLVTDKESGRSRLTDYRDGLKRLPRDVQAVYETRIKELGPILAAEKPNPEKIADWLLRCAEDPATRWEGTAELLRGIQALEYKKEREAEALENNDPELKTLVFDDLISIAAVGAMTDYHRHALTSLLVDRPPSNVPSGKHAIVRGDLELIELVTRWGDGRVAQTLIERLRMGGLTNWETSQLMASIADILKDTRLEAIADQYDDNAWRADRDRVEPDDQDVAEEDKPVDTAQTEKADPKADEKSESVEAEDVKPEPNAKPEAPEKGKQKAVQTYGQLRKELMDRFLVRADKLINKPQTAAGNTAVAK